MDYASGKILGSMCTKPLQFANKIYSAYLDKNLGDPGLWLGTWSMEREVISLIGKLLHSNHAVGYLVTGGTEANLIAVRSSRNHKSYYKSDNELIVPLSAHASFDKAADLMRCSFQSLRIRSTNMSTKCSRPIEACSCSSVPSCVSRPR